MERSWSGIVLQNSMPFRREPNRALSQKLQHRKPCVVSVCLASAQLTDSSAHCGVWTLSFSQKNRKGVLKMSLAFHISTYWSQLIRKAISGTS